MEDHIKMSRDAMNLAFLLQQPQATMTQLHTTLQSKSIRIHAITSDVNMRCIELLLQMTPKDKAVILALM